LLAGNIITENINASANLNLTGGNLKHHATTTTVTKKLVANVTGNLNLGSSGKIDVSGLGYPQGYTAGDSGVPLAINGAFPNQGGSHGGQGGARATGNSASYTFGSYLSPALPGSGGASAFNSTSVGGGAINLNVTGNCTTTSGSFIKADGNIGAAGGSIWIKCATFSGTLGSLAITANGGNGTADAVHAPGGGGRIALETTTGTITSFTNDFAIPTSDATRDTLLTKIKAVGGTPLSATTGRGGAGTVYLKHPAISYGAVLVNNDAASFTSPKDGKTLFVSTTANSNIANQRNNNNTLEIGTFLNPILNQFAGILVHVYSGANQDPYHGSHSQFLLSGSTLNEFVKTTGAAFPAVSAGSHNYRIVQRLQSIDVSGFANLDLDQSDLMLEQCSFTSPSTNSVLSIPTGSQIANIRSVASPLCTAAGIAALGAKIGAVNNFGAH
jgi:hypothetical protein